MSHPKSALVTGAAKRLGRHLAETLGGMGYMVFVHYFKSEVEARETVAAIEENGGKAKALQANLAQTEEIKALFEAVGKETNGLDVLVNNVGNYPLIPVDEMTPEDWNQTIQVNLNGLFACCHYALPLLTKAKGQIINLGVAGVEHITALPGATAYQASKTGALVLTKSLAKALGSKGIRVNMVSPGQLEFSVDLPDDVPGAIPLGRAGTGADVSGALRYLLSADYVTGVNVDVAGGYRQELT